MFTLFFPAFNLFLRGNPTKWGQVIYQNWQALQQPAFHIPDYLTMPIRQWTDRKKLRISDCLFAAYHPSLSFILCVDGGSAAALDVMPQCFHESHKRGCADSVA